MFNEYNNTPGPDCTRANYTEYRYYLGIYYMLIWYDKYYVVAIAAPGEKKNSPASF